jgi:hypothetical protein
MTKRGCDWSCKKVGHNYQNCIALRTIVKREVIIKRKYSSLRWYSARLEGDISHLTCMKEE